MMGFAKSVRTTWERPAWHTKDLNFHKVETEVLRIISFLLKKTGSTQGSNNHNWRLGQPYYWWGLLGCADL
jgi:hypothetical protein